MLHAPPHAIVLNCLRINYTNYSIPCPDLVLVEKKKGQRLHWNDLKQYSDFHVIFHSQQRKQLTLYGSNIIIDKSKCPFFHLEWDRVHEKEKNISDKTEFSIYGQHFQEGEGGGIFANNGLARAQSHAHAYYPWLSVRVDKAMRTENLRMVTAMRKWKMKN